MKKTYFKTALFAFLVSVVFVFFLFEVKKLKTEEENKEIAKKILPVESNEVVKIIYKDYQIELLDEVWQVTKPFSDYLDDERVEDWTSSLLSQEGNLLSTKEENINWEKFHLGENNVEVMQIYSKKEKLPYEVKISAKRAFDGGTYLKITQGAHAKLMVASEEWLSFFDKNFNDFRDIKIFNWKVVEPQANPQYIEFLVNNNKDYVLKKLDKEDGKESNWAYENKAGWSVDRGVLDSYFSDLQNFLAKEITSKKPVGKEEKRIFIKSQTGSEFSVSFYKEGSDYFTTSSFRPNVFLQVDKEAMESLFPEIFEFRSYQDIYGKKALENVVEVTLVNNKSTYEFIKKDSIWVEKNENSSADLNFNGAMVAKFLKDLYEINHKRFFNKKLTSYRPDKKKVTLKYKDGETLEISTGQNYQCKKKSDNKKENCVVLNSSALKDYYVVSLADDVTNLFSIKFYNELVENKVENSDKKQNKKDKKG